MRYENLDAMILHARPYRESSVIAQFFTRQEGRLAVVIKGVKRGNSPTAVQPFTRGSLACYGHGSLLTATRFEPSRQHSYSPSYGQNALSAGFYILELIVRLLPEQHAEENIFIATMTLLEQLKSCEENAQHLALILRPYEQLLLEELGFAIDYFHDANTGDPISAECDYVFVMDKGFVLQQQRHSQEIQQACVIGPQGSTKISGAMLLALAHKNYQQAGVASLAKRINQLCLDPLLGSKPLISRSLWQTKT